MAHIPVAPQPLVLAVGVALDGYDIFGFLGTIKNRLPDYGLPGVVACFSGSNGFQDCFEAMLRKHSSIKLVILRLRGFDKPDEPIKAIKKRGLSVIGIAPLRQNGHTKTINFDTLGITGYIEGKGDYVDGAARTARSLLHVTTPINTKPKAAVSGGIPIRHTGGVSEEFSLDSDDSGGGDGVDISFGITNRIGPTTADLVEDIDAQPRGRSANQGVSTAGATAHTLKLAAVTSSGSVFAQPPSSAAFPKSIRPPMAIQPKGEKTMKTDPSIGDLKTSCDQFLQALRAAVLDANSRVEEAMGQRDEISEIVAVVQADSSKLLKEIQGTAPIHHKSVKKSATATTNRRAPTAENTRSKFRNGSESLMVAGKEITLSKGAASVMTSLIASPGNVCSKKELVKICGKFMLIKHLTAIRRALDETFGEESSYALVTYHGKGWSLDLTVLKKK